MALICTLAKVMEGFLRDSLISQVSDKIAQFACSRRSTTYTDALVYLLQAVFEAANTGKFGGRLFFADFCKGLI